MENETQYDLLSLNFQEIPITNDLLVKNSDHVNNQIICSICSNILNTPIICKFCETLFCSNCIKIWLSRDNNRCSMCRNNFEEGRIIRGLMNILNESPTKCINNEKGCDIIVDYQFMKNHLEICKFTKRKAKCLGCNLIIETTNQKIEVNYHVEICVEISINCNYCKELTKRKNLEEHMKNCIGRIVKCEYCNISLTHSKKYLHGIQECTTEIINKYQSIVDELNSKLKVKDVRIKLLNLQLEEKEKIIYHSIPIPKNKFMMKNIYMNPRKKYKSNSQKGNFPKYSRVCSLKGHYNWVICLNQMNWSKDETTIISGSEDKTINLWNITENRLLRTIRGHTGPVYSLIQMNWSKDETTIVSGSGDYTISLWNAETGLLIRTIVGHSDSVFCLIQMNWSIDETTIVSGGGDCMINLWNAEDGTLIRSICGHSEGVYCLLQMNWYFNETTIVSGSEDTSIKFWDVSNGDIVRTLEGHNDSVLCLTQIINKYEPILASGSGDYTINLWNPVDGTLIRTLKGHTDSVLCLMQMNWSRDETIIVSGGNDKSIIIWDALNGTILQTLNNHKDYVLCLIQLNSSNDETTILSGSRDFTINLWNEGKENTTCLIY